MTTKNIILKIAFQLFIENWFKKVSINDLIKAVGIEPKNEKIIYTENFCCFYTFTYAHKFIWMYSNK